MFVTRRRYLRDLAHFEASIRLLEDRHSWALNREMELQGRISKLEIEGCFPKHAAAPAVTVAQPIYVEVPANHDTLLDWMSTMSTMFNSVTPGHIRVPISIFAREVCKRLGIVWNPAQFTDKASDSND